MSKLFLDTPLAKYAQRLVALKGRESRVFRRVLNNQEVRDLVKWLNTQEQLFKKGIDSDGMVLGAYSPFTVEIKKSKNQRFDHITLHDEGDFYASWRVLVLNNRIDITVDDSSKYDEPLLSVWGEKVVGLTEDSMEDLRRLAMALYVKDYFNNIVRRPNPKVVASLKARVQNKQGL